MAQPFSETLPLRRKGQVARPAPPAATKSVDSGSGTDGVPS